MLLLKPLIHYADFEGRSHRGEYVQFLSAQALFAGVLSVMGVKVIASGGASIAVALPILLGFVVLAAGALLIPNLALQVRRLHDTNRSARWMALTLPGVLAPVIMLGSVFTLLEQVTSAGAREEMVLALLGSLGTASLVWFLGVVGNVILFVILLMPGTTGSNRFGPDPRDEAVRLNQTSNMFDDSKLEVLFAEARREARTSGLASGPQGTYQPVLIHKAKPPVLQEWPAPVSSQGGLPARAFGRRGG